MREIKFRAWREDIKMMMPSNSMQELINLSASLGGMHDINSVVWMQFTGLQDKNGVDIYEGDFLGGSWRTLYVHWCEHCKSFELAMHEHGCMKCSGDVFWSDAVCADDLEVIGNVYQHPELLED